MTIALFTDAACDLPARFLTDEHIGIVPIHLNLREQTFLDQRKVSVALGFYKSYLADKNMAAETEPLSVREMVAFFEKLVPEHEHVIFISIASTRSKTYDHAMQAAITIAQRHGRAGANGHKPCTIHVIDSQTLFTGQGVLVYEAVRELKRGGSYQELVDHIHAVAPKVQSYLVPDDLYFLRNRASKKGDDSIGFMRYLLGTALDMKPIVSARLGETEVVAKARGFETAMQQVFDTAGTALDKGLAIPVVAISYAGDPRTIADTATYRDFSAKAKRHSVNVMISVMGPTGGINVGPGALALSYAA